MHKKGKLAEFDKNQSNSYNSRAIQIILITTLAKVLC